MKFKPQHYSQFIIFLFFSKLGSQYHIKHITKKIKNETKQKLKPLRSSYSGLTYEKAVLKILANFITVPLP